MVLKPNSYAQIIENLFFSKYIAGMRTVIFMREDIEQAASNLGIKPPKNFGDVIYSFRFRRAFPLSIAQTAPTGERWVIELAGKARYQFRLKPEGQTEILPNVMVEETKIPDATPGIVAMYALGDEQALLAKLRYNRLLDIFLGIACYSLQNHLRTSVPALGQVETDELYIGLDQNGVHYAIPVQAKGGKDKLGIVQIEQDIAICNNKYPTLLCRPVGAQFIGNDLIALFEFVERAGGIMLRNEKHYRLVAPDDITETDLESYK